MPAGNENPPIVSVVVLNYNGAKWIGRCLESLRQQTIFERSEIIVADNLSNDGSDKTAERLLCGWPNGRFIQHGENLGYCEGNNRAAAAARGRYLLFLNNDAWLEPDCLQKLVGEAEATGANVAMPLVLNYDDDTFQSLGAAGFDIFGLASTRMSHSGTREVFMPEGCAYLIERRLFERLGGFDREFFMYVDEFDLSWRVWLSGHNAIATTAARVHHRGAAQVNPQGGGTMVELRTSDTKRYYANRNSLLAVLKNAQNLLLLMVLLQVGLLFAEAVVALLVVRRWQFIKRAYIDALMDCWRMRQHIAAERRRIRQFRKRSDWWMLRFLRLRLNRWDEVERARRFGLPQVTAK